ncbi:YycH family regulatory protein [Bacillus sp. V33-4]|uniref:YycH family regulatory protein n=1 Tax=Bacillus sp. V33-4 TaxID=2054169 RepID=UPI000C788E2A|nr:two-component system activity regulator YycH [Bacillus sp. V33-4]PLR85745.1 hypothetical protein CVD23_08040 [Bacillus sp. V33-4]
MTYENIKTVILTILVLISGILTWNLWTFQPDFDTMDNSDYLNEVALTDHKEVSKIVKPDRIIYHVNESHFGTNSSADIDKFIREVSSWNFYETKNITTELHDMSQLVHGQGNIEIIFPDLVPIGLYKNVLKIEHENFSSFKFDRIIIDIEPEQEEGKVYFVKYGKKEEQQVFMSNINSPKLSRFYKEYYGAATQLPVYFPVNINDNKTIFLPELAIGMTKYKYLSYRLSSEKFKDALFSDPSFVQKNIIESGEEYIDSSSMMSVDHQNKILEYVNPIGENDLLIDASELLQKSIDFVNTHGGWTHAYRYAGMDEANQHVTFRFYDLKGYPVFSDTGISEISQVWGQNDIYKYTRPNFILDVPLRSEMSEVTLSSGQTSIEYLKGTKGFKLELLEDMVPGYKMSIDEENSNFIVLTPYWYYRYNGSWHRISMNEAGGIKNGLE